MIVELGLQYKTRVKTLVMLTEEPNCEDLFKHHYMAVAAVEKGSEGAIYLYGCPTQADVEQVKKLYTNINKWYRMTIVN